MERKEVISIQNLYKTYMTGEVGTGTLSHDLNRWWASLRRKPDPNTKIKLIGTKAVQSKKQEIIEAISGINLSVKSGDVLGIIGRNGAGKSTLLKILSRVTTPSAGSVKIRGRIAGLLEVGTGFHPELTGRENVYMNGTIMGMRRKEIDRKFEEIVEFAGVSNYIDTPTKRYSSGMNVRLGFAVAAFLESEILVVDEVLAVGDTEFQRKAIGRMNDVSRLDGRTVLFVSHNLVSIRQLCKSGVVLDKGKIIFEGNVSDSISKYLSVTDLSLSKTGIIEWSGDSAPGEELKLASVKLLNKENDITSSFNSDESVKVEIMYRTKIELTNMRMTLRILTESDQVVFTSSSYDYEVNKKNSGTYLATTILPANFFNQGEFKIHLHAGCPGYSRILNETPTLKFTIQKKFSENSRMNNVMPGITSPDLIWEIRSKDENHE